MSILFQICSKQTMGEMYIDCNTNIYDFVSYMLNEYASDMAFHTMNDKVHTTNIMILS